MISDRQMRKNKRSIWNAKIKNAEGVSCFIEKFFVIPLLYILLSLPIAAIPDADNLTLSLYQTPSQSSRIVKLNEN